MRHWKIYIAILLSSCWIQVQGCGVYYYFENRDAVRIRLVDPNLFQARGYNSFNYSKNYFYPLWDDSEELLKETGHADVGIDANLALWQQRCQKKVSKQAIYQAVYQLEETELTAKAENAFIQQLYQQGDEEVVNYLRFAKRAARFSTLNSYDPWERGVDLAATQQSALLKKGLEMMNNAELDEDLRTRYAFVTLRLRYYGAGESSVQEIYQQFFAKKNPQNILDYWAMHYYTYTIKDKAQRNYYAARVFSHAPDKRYAIYRMYDRNVPMEASLKFAKNERERAELWVLQGLRQPAQSLESLQKIAELAPDVSGFNFLLMREINKLEDWILTPYYTNYGPALSRFYWKEDKDQRLNNVDRIARDRGYAAELLAFLVSLDQQKSENPQTIELAMAHLKFMMGNAAGALTVIKKLQKKQPLAKALQVQYKELATLYEIAAQPRGQAFIPESRQAGFQEIAAKRHNKLLFAIARELEYKGNTTAAALLLAKLNRHESYYSDDKAFWRSKTGVTSHYANFYYHYIRYLDAGYTAQQMQELVTHIQKINPKTEFEQWLYQEVKLEMAQLYDLTGTKFIRLNQLERALAHFEQVDDTLWTSTEYPFKTYLNANPFYTNLENEHSKTKADTIRYTKESLTRQLLEYKALALKGSKAEQAYYNYLVGVCYFNMTQYGNSWMMRRYFWSTREAYYKMVDDEEFFKCKLAIQYLDRAYQLAQAPKFKALCLAMAGRCNRYKLQRELIHDADLYYYRDKEKYDEALALVTDKNSYLQLMQKQMPEAYEELWSKCLPIDSYLQAGQ